MMVNRLSLAALVLAVATPLFAQSVPGAPREALDGVDPVALLTQGKEITGKPAFKVTRGKFEYLFATAENQAAFEKTPEKYEVQLSGACARMGGGVTGNPSDYAVVDGKIYIFGSDECHKKFVAAPAKYLPRPAASMPTAAASVQAGRALLDKAVKALGGAERLDNLTTYVEISSQARKIPDGEATLTVKTLRRYPGDIRVERTFSTAGRTQASGALLTPAGGWFLGQGGRAFPQSPEGRLAAEQEYDRQLLAVLRARRAADFKAVALEPSVVDGITLDRVRVKNGAVDVILGLERKSGEVRSLSYVGRNADAEIGDITLVLSDYRDVSGLRLPFGERALFNGVPDDAMTRKISSIEINVPLDATLFQPPAAGGQ